MKEILKIIILSQPRQLSTGKVRQLQIIALGRREQKSEWRKKGFCDHDIGMFLSTDYAVFNIVQKGAGGGSSVSNNVKSNFIICRERHPLLLNPMTKTTSTKKVL